MKRYLMLCMAVGLLLALSLPLEGASGEPRRGGTFTVAVRRGAQLHHANLREVPLQRADLRGANLQEANLSGTNLQEADLREVQLQRADLRGANLEWANLREANLQEANLDGAKGLTSPQFKAAKNWQMAFYRDDILKELGLPSDHNEIVKKKLAEPEKEKKEAGTKK